jgi:signal peptidase
MFAIEGSSMVPRLKPGDLIIAVKTRKLSINDIVIFRHPVAGIVAHRIIDKANQGCYTKGDNNPLRDPDILQENQVIGKMWFRIPWLGQPRNLIKKMLGW